MDDYMVQVCNLSTKATVKDIKQFFSYSGTIKNVKLERTGQSAQVALVSFKEPYALETAVLLSGATIIDQKVCIVPWGESEEAVDRWKKQMIKLQEEGNTQGPGIYNPSADQAVNVVTTMLSKGYRLGKDTLSKAKELDEKYQVMNTAAAKAADIGKFIGHKSKAALIAAGHAACSAGVAAVNSSYSAGVAAVNSSYFAAGALMVSGVLDKAAKAAADLGNRGNRGNAVKEVDADLGNRGNAVKEVDAYLDSRGNAVKKVDADLDNRGNAVKEVDADLDSGGNAVKEVVADFDLDSGGNAVKEVVADLDNRGNAVTEVDDGLDNRGNAVKEVESKDFVNIQHDLEI